MLDPRERVIQAVLRILQSDVEPGHPWEDELGEEELALACRSYVEEVNNSDYQPIGW